MSIALVDFMAVTLTAISRASTDALRLPLENVLADIVVQLSVDIPQKLEGLVFSHPTAQLPAVIVEEIKKTFRSNTNCRSRIFVGLITN